MIKKIQNRFIMFTMLVISIIVFIVSLIFLVGEADNVRQHRTFTLAVIILVLVFIASLLLSRIAINPIKKAWQQQLDFTADASHELRTPLAVIQSNLEIIMDDEESTISDQKKWLDNIHKETLLMNSLVEDLLTLSRADCGNSQLLFTDIPITDIINEQLHAFEAPARSKNITLESQFNIAPVIQADSALLSRLFRILIDNSLKYMGRPGSIIITVSKDPKNRKAIKIIYTDDGLGIPASETSEVFKRFYRADKSRTRKEGGTGLGLAIAKWIVETHNGKITLTSDTNSGVTFTITLGLLPSSKIVHRKCRPM